MKLYTRIVVDMTSGAWLEADSTDYAGPLALAGGGGSSSSSATTTTTQDRRQVVEQGVAVSSDSSTVNVTATDQGAVAAALEFATAAGAGVLEADLANQDTVNRLLGIADKVFVGAFETIGKTSEAVMTAGQGVATAYEGAQGAGNEKTLLALAALAVVGIVAVKVWGK